MNKDTGICLYRSSVFEYPDKTSLFRPSIAYPEYVFQQDLSDRNEVYDIVRNAFCLYGLDKENYNTKRWNPLGEIVKPGDKVVIKPNMVLDRNYNPRSSLECLVTHPSVVAVVVDYVIKALEGRGKIIIGDAPLQECDFAQLIKESGYEELVDYYKSRGVSIELKDFRNIKTFVKNGVRYDQIPDENVENGLIVDFSQESAFGEFSADKLSRLRIDNFDPRVIQQHQKPDLHEYKIAKDILDADVIINMPKPKTHRKAGVTISLKNLIGINAGKEYLPHHTLGSKEEGGDAYFHSNLHLSAANEKLDEKNLLVSEKKYKEAEHKDKDSNDALLRGIQESGERYWDGCWYGNDTIWRTISDLNRILAYADKNGVVRNTPQRRIFIVADMIIGGHREGPLEPSAIRSGTIAIGYNPLLFDKAVCSVMGIDWKKIPSLNSRFLISGVYRIADDIEPGIISNYDKWNGRQLNMIRDEASLGFVPSWGWEIVLGNPRKEAFVERINNAGLPIYIYGAGKYGKDIYLYLKEIGVKVPLLGFLDSNKEKWGMEVFKDVLCNRPVDYKYECNCVISASADKIQGIKESAMKYNFNELFLWEEEYE